MSPDQVKLCRRTLDLSLSELAGAVGVRSARTARRWESGDSDVPGPVERLLWLLLNYGAVREHLLGHELRNRSVLSAGALSSTARDIWPDGCPRAEVED